MTRESGGFTPTSNFEAAVRAEAKKVVRYFQRYSPEQRTNIGASHRLGHRQRRVIGEAFYCHPAAPNAAFPTRRAAALYALEILA